MINKDILNNINITGQNTLKSKEIKNINDTFSYELISGSNEIDNLILNDNLGTKNIIK